MIEQVEILVMLTTARKQIIKKENQVLEQMFLKSVNTLKYLLTKEFGFEQLYYSYIAAYPEVTYENTLKMMLRCRLILRARNIVGRILTMIPDR